MNIDDDIYVPRYLPKVIYPKDGPCATTSSPTHRRNPRGGSSRGCRKNR